MAPPVQIRRRRDVALVVTVVLADIEGNVTAYSWRDAMDFAALAGLVPEDYAAHWQIILQFLSIVTEQWPAILANLGSIGPAERRRRPLRPP